jgi:osmotically inducible protein OsmC
MIRSAKAVWKGGLKDGTGTFTAATGVFKDVSYDFGRRFTDTPGTNPEELIASAHASCYAMALSGKLEGAGHKADSIETKAALTFEKLDVGFTATRMHLETVVKAAGLTNETLQKCAEEARRTCPISRLLNTTITIDAKLA